MSGMTRMIWLATQGGEVVGASGVGGSTIDLNAARMTAPLNEVLEPVVIDEVVAVPVADLRSVWVLRPEEAKGLPHPVGSGVYVHSYHDGYNVGVGACTHGLQFDGLWTMRFRDFHKWPDFDAALAAARAVVEKARKEAGG